MSQPPSLLARWWRRLRSRKEAPPQPVRLESAPRPRPRPEERPSGIEPLEGRIAPATLAAGGRDLLYTDIDGDKVDVHFSKPMFAGLTGAALNNALDHVFVFNTGDAHNSAAQAQQLERIDLTLAPLSDSAINLAGGTSLSVRVTSKGPNGDGLANVGAIEASGLALGTVTVAGDLGHINAGNNNSPLAVQALSLGSLGKLTNTQASPSTYASGFTGGLGSFHLGSMTEAQVVVSNGAAVHGRVIAVGGIGSLTIGTAGAANSDVMTGTATLDSASIIAAGNIGSVKVYGNLHGGSGGKSAAISAGGSIGSVLVVGKLIGDVGDDSASIQTGNAIGSVTLINPGGDVLEGGSLGDRSGAIISGTAMGPVVLRGSILGGGGDNSGEVKSGAMLASVSIVGNITGGGGTSSGALASTAFGAISISGQLTGSAGDDSGSIGAGFGGAGTILSVSIGQGVVGGGGDSSGTVTALGVIHSVVLGKDGATGFSLQGGAGQGSAVISSEGAIGSALLLGGIQGIGNTIVSPATTPSGDGDQSAGLTAGTTIGSVRINGSLVGSPTATHSGYVEAELGLGPVVITGSLEGGGLHSGVVASGAALTSVSVGVDLKGGAYAFSGSIVSGWSGSGALGSVTIGGGITGGAGAESGSISSGGALGTVRISLPSGSAGTVALQGAGGDYSGSIFSGGPIGSVTVKGAIAGGGGSHSGSIEGHGTVSAVTATALTGGGGPESGSILADDFFSGATVRTANLALLNLGAVTGGAGLFSGSLISESNIGTVNASQLVQGSEPTGASIRSGIGSLGVGNVTALHITHLGLAGGAGGGTLEIHGTLGQLTATEIVNAALHAVNVGTISTGVLSGTTITTLGQPAAATGTDLALARLIVTGNVSGSSILAGYDLDGTAANGHAQIGTVSVGGNWSATSLIAGVSDPSHDGFGSPDDAAIPLTVSSHLLSSIASVVIRGTVSGDATAQIYGIEAEAIANVQYGASVLHPAAASSTQIAPHVFVREVPVPASV